MMDRRLKERLVGATILVALIVLIVPELLSGPKRPGLPPLAAGLPATASRSVVVDLDTSKATAEPESGAVSQAASPDAANNAGAASAASRAAEENAHPAIAEPAPATAPSVATLKAQNAAQPPLETSASPPKSVAAAPHPAAPTEAPAAPRHGWAVQLGSFASRTNAERLVHRLQGSGGSFYVVPGGSGSSLRYRVRMGPLTDRSAAERALARLKAQGHSATIVTPAS
jgi:DedD protein